MDDEFSARSFNLVGEIEVRITNDGSRFFGDEMAIVFVATVTEVEQYVFCNGWDAIDISCECDKGEDFF
jgi:hypothetical protein